MEGWVVAVDPDRWRLTTRPNFCLDAVAPEVPEDKWTLLKLGCRQSFKTLVESVVISSKQKFSVERCDEFLRMADFLKPTIE